VLRADVAMYADEADTGGSRAEVFRADMAPNSASSWYSSRSASRLHRGAFIVHYQPDSSGDRASVGVGKLSSDGVAEGGIVMPVRLIPIAEETGLILPRGSSCASEWRQTRRGSARVLSPTLVTGERSGPRFGRRDRGLVQGA